ncbi:Polyisoprenoid-binding protein YceI [Parapedobacter composti]|uniref:Polyisoprenoid-binding protein YceI n=1 Tax=Parapedobacter composti TaxID=623281 RepID=A0A1I1KEL8_9SPHI|nr:YceI family protein [Parapedobacter composti]SFC58975.1 Polyisoprenoid-binding protein YceI [Parapedobacter composti]
MKKFNALFLAGLAAFAVACGGNTTKQAQTAEAQQVAEKQGAVYAVNLDASELTWKAFHKGGFAPRWGTLNIQSGELSVADGAITGGDFVIDMASLKVDSASVTEGDKKHTDLEGHLKSEDFFNVAQFPVAEFKITQIADLGGEPVDGAVAGANKRVSGNLTLLDSTLNIAFPAKVVVADGKVSVVAQFTVNRADWGIKFGTSEADPAEWGISKDIEIGVAVEAEAK